MGRNAAGESFLKGYLLYSQANEFCAQVLDVKDADRFSATVRAYGRTEPVRTASMTSLATLETMGLVYFPGPGIGAHAWHRASFGAQKWALCGVTHTTSSSVAMDGITDLLTSPVEAWDSLICTSQAVKNNVNRMLQAQADYLLGRLGITKLVLPQLPVIPLGIHTADFVYNHSQRVAARSSLGIDEQTLVVLFIGRLSFHAKAHPLAMYEALERAARQTGKQVVLVECGWHANEHVAQAYEDAALNACPNVRVVTLDGRDAKNREIAWAGADIFCSLSDNIQETFGISPIEAMACGLPVVVSDWDGYKDTVRDGVDGFRIPTLMPPPGYGRDLAVRHALEIENYDKYIGYACSLIAVDVGATTEAFVRLFESPELRKQMGEAGRRRAQEVYDWRVIIPQYEALWAEQDKIRLAAAGNTTQLPHPWPARLDPFYGFAAYPTQTLSEQTVLGLVDDDVAKALQRTQSCLELAMVNFAQFVLPTEEEIKVVLNSVSTGAKTSAEIVSAIPIERRPFVFRALVWFVKIHVLKVCS